MCARNACGRLLAHYPDIDAVCVPEDAFAVGALAVDLLFEHLSGHKERQCVMGLAPQLRVRASTQAQS